MSELVPDKLALEELRASGVDIAKPVQVVHYFYCDKKNDADRIGSVVSAEGFRVQVRRGALGDNWLVLATRTQVLNDVAVAELRSFFEKLAPTVSGGEYDGWEVAIQSGNQ